MRRRSTLIGNVHHCSSHRPRRLPVLPDHRRLVAPVGTKGSAVRATGTLTRTGLEGNAHRHSFTFSSTVRKFGRWVSSSVTS